MNQTYNMLRLLVLIVCLGSWSESVAQDKLWTVGTAKTVPKGTLEASLFHPWKYGVTGRFELSAQPVAFLIAPHVQAKYTWLDKQVKVASVHSVSYPSLFMRTIGKWQRWGAIDAHEQVPNMVAFKNELIVSYMLKKATSCTAENFLVSLKVGVKNALRWDENTMGYINKAPFFHHSATVQPNYVRYVGADLDAYLTEKLDYSIDADFLQVRGEIKRWLGQHKAILIWKPNDKWRLAGGYKIVAGTFLNDFEFRVLPLIDATYIWRKKRSKEMELFKQKMF